MNMTFYKLITYLLYPAFWLLLIVRFVIGKENKKSFKEKRGIIAAQDLSKPRLWFHGASVGESLSLLPLIDKLANIYPQWDFIITTGTISSGAILEQKLKDKINIQHHYLPFDFPCWVERFLKTVNPQIAFMSESDFWPNLISQTKKHNLPIILLNGRMSPKSFKNWQKRIGFARKLFSNFDLTIVQTPQDETFFTTLGAHNVVRTGNMKYSNPPLTFNEDDLRDLKQNIQNRPLWLFSSSHGGEEEIALNTHTALNEKHNDLLTIIVLRHPNRKNDVKTVLEKQKHKFAFRSDVGNHISSDTEIYVVDSFGELGLFYTLTDITCIGGSFVPLGCHNPIEAAQLDCAILFGPHIFNFTETCSELLQEKAAIQVNNQKDFIEKFSLLFDDKKKIELLKNNAKKYAKSKSGILSLVESKIAPYLNTVEK